MTAWGRIRSRAAFTAAASSASAMTGSAPISFNGGAESGDRVSANTSCWFALRRRTRGRPIAPLAPAIRILIALPCSARFGEPDRDLLGDPTDEVAVRFVERATRMDS